MNLFVLDLDPVLAARQNCDSHVCKIILEAADMLCIAHWENGGLPVGAPTELTTPRVITDKLGRVREIYRYRAESHTNNHISQWVRASLQNYDWTAAHGVELCREYERRYGHTAKRRGAVAHATRRFVEWFAANRPPLPDIGLTEFRQGVAREPFDCYREGDPVTAYREYYIHYKAGFAKWRLGNIPDWFAEATKVPINGASTDTAELAVTTSLA